MRRTGALALAALLAACAGPPKKSTPPPTADAPTPAASTPRKVSPYAPAQEDPRKRGDYVAGGLYAPGVKDTVPDYVPDVERIPEPDVVDEPRSRYGNRSPYQVLGKSYRVLDRVDDYVEQGIASFYGNKFHGRRTSNLEVYDMYAFTAAHKTLPLPSFARVTNLDNGKTVVVRVNDRGPFHDGRVIDLSYAAAVKLGIHARGTGRVEVRALVPGRNAPVTARAAAPAAADATSSDAVASGMDRLVASIPMSGAQLADASAAGAPAGREHRFDMHQDGRAMTADEFDAWMRARRVRVATGAPAAVARDAGRTD
ncbi:septal ring lytic transglycosylase RlpA family protein, partial [Tolypothrix campylonemoides VB511288]